MAEIAVISSVIANLVPLLNEEAKLLRGVRRDASSLIAELEMIKPFLKKADERAERGELDDGQKVWMKQVREVFYQIEDSIDEYILHLARHPQQHGFIGFFSKVTRLIKKLKARHDIASEIQEIKSTIRQIKERGETYGFSTVGRGSSGGSGNNIEWHDPRVASHFIDEDEVVGIESQRNELVSWLVEGSPKRVSISVVGMGGSGKTTLTNKVYEDTTVNSHFGFLAWIEVSQSYKKEEILKAIIKQFLQDMEMKWNALDQEMDRMNLKALIKTLRDYLDAKRYVIFFDDVWDQEFWNFIKHALPDKNKGNRVVITTRYVDVAASCKESQFDHVQTLQPLPQEKAWELFCKKAFQADFGGICPSDLKDLSRDILKRCEGLPLAIVTIGGVLATKEKVIHQWQAFSNSLGSELGSNPRFKGTKRVLSLNFLDLPYHLQLCYLYFGIIPSGYSISRTKLIRLWIAEGLVQGKGGKTLEEIGEEYLTELKHRNLVQVSYVDFARKVRCRVHDIMREIILLISNDLGFCSISSKENSGVESFHGLTRRFSIHNYADNIREGITGSRIRSFFCFDEDVLPLFCGFFIFKFQAFERNGF